MQGFWQTKSILAWISHLYLRLLSYKVIKQWRKLENENKFKRKIKKKRRKMIIAVLSMMLDWARLC